MFRAIGLVEFQSIAQGIAAADAMLKTADVELVTASTICPGKYMVMVSGDVAAVENSVRVGAELDETSVVDEFIIPNVHPDVFPAITGTTQIEQINALGIIETFSLASLIVAADAAVKASEVKLIEIRLGLAIGGKSFVTLTGEVAAVEAAVQAGDRIASEKGMLAKSIVIPSPHQLLKEVIL